MDWIRPTEAFIANLWAYIEWCVGHDILAPICQPFWAWTIGASLVIAVLVIAWMLLKFVSYRIKLAAALKAEAERAKVADEETMRAHSWEGDNAFQTDLPSAEIEQR